MKSYDLEPGEQLRYSRLLPVQREKMNELLQRTDISFGMALTVAETTYA